MPFAVINCGVLLTDNSHCHIDRVDCHITVCNLECDISESRVLVFELAFKFHVRCTSICSCHVIRTREGEVIRCIRRVADGDSIAGRFMFGTVIIHCGVVTGDSHNNSTGRGDFQPTVRHIERHHDVRIAVAELVGGKTHQMRTDRGVHYEIIAREGH